MNPKHSPIHNGFSSFLAKLAALAKGWQCQLVKHSWSLADT